MARERFEKLPLIALCFGWFMVIVDATIVNVALPKLGAELGASVGGLQWVVDAYTVVFAALLLSAGWFGDRFGGRIVFQGGLALFVLASLGCTLAPNLAVLITARAVQGVGAAALVPSSLSLVHASYSDQRVRARAIGIWAMVGGVASGCGPLLGGILAGTLGWRWLFGVNIPVGVIGLVMVWRYVTVGREPAERARDRRFDRWGQLTAVVALVCLTAALVQMGQSGPASADTLALFAAFVVGTVAFLAAERRVPHPMLPLPLFRSRAVSAATSVGLLMNFGFYGQLFVLTLYLQQVRHYPPLITGLALLPQTGVIAFGSWLGGRLTSRSGPRLPMLIGMSVGAAGFFALTIIHVGIGYGLLVAPIAAAGFGISFTMPAATAAVVEGVPADRSGIASGTLNASRQVGGALGIALLGSFIGGAPAHFVAGFRIAVLIAGAAYVLGTLVAALVPREVEESEVERVAQLVNK